MSKHSRLRRRAAAGQIYTLPPRAVTVTPLGALTATPFGTASPEARTATALPTTTPFPRCRPRPGETVRPWPTPVPPPPPYATFAPEPWQGGSDLETVMQLPGTVYSIDLAAHPIDGWPVVAATQRSWGSPIRAYVRVYNPAGRTWGLAQQIDLGESSLGTDRFGSIAVGITGDNTIYAAWGASDDDRGAVPSIWVSTSTDLGATWTPPTQIAENCWSVLDLATSIEGTVVVMANCFDHTASAYVGHATVIVRHPGEAWQPTERIDAPAWSGSVALVGENADLRVVLLTAALTPPEAQTLFLSQKRLADGQRWTTQRIPFTPRGSPLDDLDGSAPIHIRSTVYDYTGTNGVSHDAVTFTWATVERAALFALSSLDDGQHWGQIETIVHRSGTPQQGDQIPFIAPAYDALSNHLVAFWPCCGTTLNEAGAATHYVSWSVPGSGEWTSDDAPLVTGARAAYDTEAAQARNRRTVWLAWIEQGQQVRVRTLDLATVLPTVDAPPMQRLP